MGSPGPRVTVRAVPQPGAGIAVAVGAVVAAVAGWGHAHAVAYGFVLYGLLTVRLVLSMLPVPDRGRGVRRRVYVGVVVPVFNEDVGLLRACLESIDGQTRRPGMVVVVDDGSTDRAAVEWAEEWAATRPWVHVHCRPVNTGKRDALAWAWTACEADLWVTVDSDTVLMPGAVAALVDVFERDESVYAATGTVLAANPHAGPLSALIDMRYANAFLLDRAAQSRLGSVLCCCGSLAAYRGHVIDRHVAGFTSQVFLGERQQFGDDRHLTNLALADGGRVVLARDAVALTAVPVRLRHFLRQQTRWAKSFFRESAWALMHLRPNRWAWWLTLVEVVTWTGFTGALVWTVAGRPLATGDFGVAAYVVALVAAAYARSVHVLAVDRSDWPRGWLWAAFVGAPVYGLLHVVVLIPLRLWALATLRRGSWGTRASGVEVAAD